MSQPMYHAPNRLTIIAIIISQIAGPALLTNLADPAANKPKIIIAIPQKNVLIAYKRIPNQKKYSKSSAYAKNYQNYCSNHT